ncbi:Phyllocladan-16-alpha-ol synthase [Penicillium concentricum]|uniref:Phyllocladan-16-alpha-ol synthase n=1 Tax=Penicillium concentricum TaxID=293559 RepID=A0A9W9VHF0_9EURO|nr:Phyllocladan-16-alpha-ol synthase [Penicillium concentricum]KAJ5382328.1 Phyllocladan-16-alpha-ol synthase [Penicillium concentricum]
MELNSLPRSAEVLVNQLIERIDDSHGLGFMSPAVYDTAWVSMVQKPVDGYTVWLFPECFEYILSNQLEDGSWVMYASQIDGILNTAASLLSLKRHFTSPLQISTISQEDLAERINRATRALHAMLDEWDVDATVHVGFEILVPALLGYLETEGIVLSFPGRDRLFAVRDQKLVRFKPELLYMPVQTPALHSLEAFIGSIEFDRVRHHKVNGSFMASPSSTSAVLMHTSEWDDECEEYLHHVIQSASGNRSGGVPSAFPSTTFEITWTLSTLIKNGFDLDPKILPSIQKAQTYLHDTLVMEEGTVGFTAHVCADADDTAKAILVLQLLQQHVSLEPMLKAFEAEHHFKTYPYERDPSFSANCNVLLALLYTDDVSQYASQIEKATRFLHTHFRETDLKVRDKWNLSPFYSWMLMTEAIARLHLLFQSSQLLSLKELFEQDLVNLLRDMTASVLHQQNQTSSWGSRDSKEETAYAVLMLAYAVHFEFSEIPRHLIRKAIHDGCSFLRSNAALGSERLWVEKVTYESEMLSQAYTLAALKKAADLPPEAQHHPEGVSMSSADEHPAESIERPVVPNGHHTHVIEDPAELNGHPSEPIEPPVVPNGHRAEVVEDHAELNGHPAEPIEHSVVPNGHHAGVFKDHAELNGNPAEPIETNGHIAELTEIESKSTNGAFCTETENTETKMNDVLTTHTVELHGPHENGNVQTESTELTAVGFNGPSSHSCRREWTEDEEQILLGPFDYLESLPGKSIRSQFIQAFNSWLQVTPEHLEVVEKAISMLHTASLLVDDIEDSSLLRRGQPVAHNIFGMAQTFNSGNYVYFLALREIQKLESPRAIEIYVDALIHLHRGQGMDMFWRDSLICPTEEDYLAMVGNKTGALFCLAVELLQIGSPVQVDLVPLVRLFGIIFQVCDDYLNLKSPAYLQKKGLCEDLTEGKFSFPIIHSIRSNPSNRRLINILKHKPRDDDIKRYAVAYMETTNTFEYTRDFVGSLKAEALEMIENLEKQGLGENLAIRKLLARLSVDV